MSERLNELGEHISAQLDSAIREWSVDTGELTITMAAPNIAKLMEIPAR
nr:hypothetical protein [Hyphobacterium sp. CCMP332]